MATETASEQQSTGNQWYDATIALLGGIAVFGALVLHVATIQTPGLSPPTGAIPLFVFNTTAAAISFVLLRRAHPAGYLAATVTAVLVVTSIVLIGSGAVGDLKPGTNPLGPLSYAGLGVALLLTTALAWRKRAETGALPTPTPNAE